MAMNRVIIIGKMPPPVMGTPIWNETLRNSKLNEFFKIDWLDIKAADDINEIGRFHLKKIIRYPKIYFHFFKELIFFKPDLVLVPISQSTLGFIKDSIFILLSKRNTRTLVMLHGGNLENWLASSSRFVQKYVKYVLSNTMGVIVLGQALRQIFSTFFNPNQIFVAPNGINVEYLSVPRKGSELIIRYLGNLQPSKGIMDLILAIEIIHLNKKMKNYKLIVNGQWRDEATKNACEILVKTNKLPVQFDGPVYGNAKVLALQQSDIFVFTPNMPEGHPYCIIEALSAKLPIISTNQGAITESVIDQWNGFIVKTHSPEEIAEKICYLAFNRTERELMAINSRKIYEEKFTADAMATNYRQIFDAVIKEDFQD